MTTLTHVPPGFRFHPTDEELVDYYLRRKVSSRRIDLDVIRDVDLYRIEPWDLQELCQIGAAEQNEWYFFSHKDKKYPTGTRTNRATAAGFWKATGRDKAIYSKHELIGMRKTLVFYKGRAPNGQKSDWIMHEYRLETEENGTPQEEGWAVCKVFKKRIPTMQRLGERDSPIWYDDQVSFMADIGYPYNTSGKKEEMNLQYAIRPDHFLQLPNLESPNLLHPQTSMALPSYVALNTNPGSNLQSLWLSQDIHQTSGDLIVQSMFTNNAEPYSVDQITDWRVLDKVVASQLSQNEISKENETNFHAGQESILITNNLNKREMVPENASGSSSSCQIDLWR
ncbi:hypothetical protein OROGR_011230 [Orobanche gracilis]